MDNPKFQIFTGNDEQFYFRLRAENGEPILGSEGYTRKASCKNGVTSVRLNSEDDTNFKRKIASDGQFYFVLVDENGETIGKSEDLQVERRVGERDRSRQEGRSRCSGGGSYVGVVRKETLREKLATPGRS